MKRFFLLLLILPTLISLACMSTGQIAATATVPGAPATAAAPQVTATPDSALLPSLTPELGVTPVEGGTREISVTPGTGETPLPSPTISASPVPSQEPLWTWVSDTASGNILAVNQDGEKRVAGKLTPDDFDNSHFETIDAERAFLFLTQGTRLRVFVVSLSDMRELHLPGEPVQIDANYSRDHMSVVAVSPPGKSADAAVFVYPVENEWAGSNVHPYVGPLVWVDLNTLRAERVESNASFEVSNPRPWFHASADGRSLRYSAGDETTTLIRELDMQSAAARTIYTTRGSAYNLTTNPQGDLWRAMRAKVLVTLDGQTQAFDDAASLPRIMADGLTVVFPRSCNGDCALKVTRPFGADPGLAYKFPWPLEDGVGANGATYLLPDQSLIVVGAAASSFARTYPAVAQYPDLPKGDSPLFRLSPGGEARLIGSYDNNEIDYRRPISGDGRYLLLKKPDQSAYFLYDAFTDSDLAVFPLKTGVTRPMLGFRFQPAGVLVKFTYRKAGAGGEQDEWFYNSYSYAQGTAQIEKDPQPDIIACLSVLSDGSLECWVFGAGGDTSNLARFEPASGRLVTLAENVLALGDFGE
jgi:hypothetical protein